MRLEVKLLVFCLVFQLVLQSPLASVCLKPNAIQFGLDQLLEAPTPKQITFIHCYYWSQNAAGLVVFYIFHICYF